MMMTNSTSLFGGLVSLVIVVALLALVAGLALSGTDLLNPNTSSANASAINQATQSKIEKEALERKLQEARAEAELDKIRQEAEARQRELEQTLALAAQRHQYELAQAERRDQMVDSLLLLVVGAVMVAILIVGGGLTYYLIQCGRSRWAGAQLHMLTQAADLDLWHDLTWRAQQINKARANEVARRQVDVVRNAATRSAFGDNGQHPVTSNPVRESTSNTRRG